MSDDELDEEMIEMLELEEIQASFNRDLGLDTMDIPVISFENVTTIFLPHHKIAFNSLQIHSSPIVRSTFCQMKIDHKSALTLYPGY